MTEHPMLELVPLYALDALEGREKTDFEGHVDSCVECQAALVEYLAVAGDLVPNVPASEATWQSINQSIASDAGVVDIESARTGRVWQWIAGVAAATAVILAGILVSNSLQTGELTADQIESAAALAAAEEGAFVGDFLVDQVSVAQVVLTSDGRGFVVPTDELAPLEETHTYQLWVINDREDVISAGVLGAAPAAATFTWTGDVSGFALTREVAEGVISSAGDVVSVITGA